MFPQVDQSRLHFAYGTEQSCPFSRAVWFNVDLEGSVLLPSVLTVTKLRSVAVLSGAMKAEVSGAGQRRDWTIQGFPHGQGLSLCILDKSHGCIAGRYTHK